YPPKPWIITTDLDAPKGYWTKMSARDHVVPLAESQHYVINTTNLCRALNDRIEHRLHIRRRAADDAEYLRRCRLMFQRLAQFRIAFLDLLEQSHVFNCDHRLVGKSLQQCDLLFSKRTDLHPMNRDRADRRAFSEHRRRQQRANAETSPARRSSGVLRLCH